MTGKKYQTTSPFSGRGFFICGGWKGGKILRAGNTAGNDEKWQQKRDSAKY